MWRSLPLLFITLIISFTTEASPGLSLAVGRTELPLACESFISLQSTQGEDALYSLNVQLDELTAQKLTKLTQTHIGQVLKVFLDDQLISSPVIESTLGKQLRLAAFNYEHLLRLQGLCPLLKVTSKP
jgi:hypothetical protein